jgi:hypothetical protein
MKGLSKEGLKVSKVSYDQKKALKLLSIESNSNAFSQTYSV